MGNMAVVLLPRYTDKIIDCLSQDEWLFTAFQFKDPNQLYNPGNYLYNKLRGDTYVLVLYRNIFDYLLKALKCPSSNEHCRRAVALLVFCHIAEIEIDPSFATTESLSSSGLEETLDKLATFDNINNADTDLLADYALSTSAILKLEVTTSLEHRENATNKLQNYEKPSDWRSIYLMILKIVIIDSDTSIKQKDKTGIFLDWIVSEFRFSMSIFVYTLILFGKQHKRPKDMMNYKITTGEIKKPK